MRRLPLKRYLRSGWDLLTDRDNSRPFYASFKVSSLCHFSCSFCNIWREKEKKTLTLAECRAILDNLGHSPVFLTSLEGGEPLLHPEIEGILQHAAQQPFHVMLTTSVHNLRDYPWDHWKQWVDFLEVSIDEGHRNLELFDVIGELRNQGLGVSVQTVVRAQDLEAMETKVRMAKEADCRILLMPAVELEGAQAAFPMFAAFRERVLELKKQYPRTVITPKAYFRRMAMEKGGCSTNSIVIDADGSLYYPCRTLETKALDLRTESLASFLQTPEAKSLRKTMADCDRRCGWYQYFATGGFLSPSEFWDAFRPYAADYAFPWRNTFAMGNGSVPK